MARKVYRKYPFIYKSTLEKFFRKKNFYSNFLFQNDNQSSKVNNIWTKQKKNNPR